MYDVIERKTNCKENLPASSKAAKHKYVGQPLLKCSSFAPIFFINKYFFFLFIWAKNYNDFCVNISGASCSKLG